MSLTSTDGFVTRTKVDVGMTWMHRFDSGGRRHIVVKQEGSPHEWTTLCDGARAVREYLGWMEVAVSCGPCKAAYRR